MICCCWVEVKICTLSLEQAKGSSPDERTEDYRSPPGFESTPNQTQAFWGGGRGAKQANNPLFHP